MRDMSQKDRIRAAIYVRISRDSEGTGLGVKRQRTDCQELATKLGWRVVKVYEDNDVSASNGKPRPDFQRLMAAVTEGDIDAVVVWDVDRLTRTPRELEDVIDHADRAGLKLASVGGDIDLGTEQGRMMARMKGSVARYEIEQSRRRLKAKHLELAASGRYNGPRPFGWYLVGKGPQQRLVINPVEAEIIRECVDRILRGEALWRLKNDLNNRGVTTAKGGQWQTQTLRRMLLRWMNAGFRQHQTATSGRVFGTSQAPLYRGQWDPIIDRDTHERVIATLTDPGRRSNNRGTAVKYLLTGIARCGECGGPLVGVCEHSYEVKVKRASGPTTRTRRYPAAYKCPHVGCMRVQRKMAVVDQHVSDVVVDLLDRDRVRLLGGDPGVVEAAEKRISVLQGKLIVAADQFSADLITETQLERITARVRPQLEAEKERRRRALPAAEFKDLLARGSVAWLEADVETQRQILRLIGMVPIVSRVGPGNTTVAVEDAIRVLPQEEAEELLAEHQRDAANVAAEA